MRRYWLQELGLLTQGDLLMDTKPIPVMGYKPVKSAVILLGVLITVIVRAET